MSFNSTDHLDMDGFEVSAVSIVDGGSAKLVAAVVIFMTGVLTLLRRKRAPFGRRPVMFRIVYSFSYPIYLIMLSLRSPCLRVVGLVYYLELLGLCSLVAYAFVIFCEFRQSQLNAELLMSSSMELQVGLLRRRELFERWGSTSTVMKIVVAYTLIVGTIQTVTSLLMDFGTKVYATCDVLDKDASRPLTPRVVFGALNYLCLILATFFLVYKYTRRLGGVRDRLALKRELMALAVLELISTVGVLGGYFLGGFLRHVVWGVGVTLIEVFCSWPLILTSFGVWSYGMGWSFGTTEPNDNNNNNTNDATKNDNNFNEEERREEVGEVNNNAGKQQGERRRSSSSSSLSWMTNRKKSAAESLDKTLRRLQAKVDWPRVSRLERALASQSFRKAFIEYHVAVLDSSLLLLAERLCALLNAYRYESIRPAAVTPHAVIASFTTMSVQMIDFPVRPTVTELVKNAAKAASNDTVMEIFALAYHDIMIGLEERLGAPSLRELRRNSASLDDDRPMLSSSDSDRLMTVWEAKRAAQLESSEYSISDNQISQTLSFFAHFDSACSSVSDASEVTGSTTTDDELATQPSSSRVSHSPPRHQPPNTHDVLPYSLRLFDEVEQDEEI